DNALLGVQCVGNHERMNSYGGMTISRNPLLRISGETRTTPYGRIWLNTDPADRGSRPASTLPPSSGGIGIMLNTASRTLSCTSWLRIRAIGTEIVGSPTGCGDRGSRISPLAATTASTRFLAGPAAAINT